MALGASMAVLAPALWLGACLAIHVRHAEWMAISLPLRLLILAPVVAAAGVLASVGGSYIGRARWGSPR